MTHLRGLLFGLAALCLAVLLTPAVVGADAKELKSVEKWSGSVDDEKLLKEAPENGVITDAKTFTKVWTAWKIGDKEPKLDFDKVIVVFQTTAGSKISAKPMLDDKGDLKFLGLATKDLKPGFRYDMQAVEKEGIKTVNGKEIGKK
jgi:hypothetical protein